MRQKKSGWKRPALLFLVLLLLAQIGDIVYLQYFDTSRRRLPVLMYHHFADEAKEGTVVTPVRFREQMNALKEAGYQAVTIPQVIDYVENGAPLPARPILITMDDGYGSNLDTAAPILEETGMCATVFAIGINEGEEYYPHSGEPMWQERFAFEKAAPWVEKGIIDVQSHTFDMHQLASYGYSGRDGVLRLEGESDEDYRQALLSDTEAFRQRRGNRVGTELLALAYPFGYYSEEADALLKEAGYAVTFTIDERPNYLSVHNGSCLRMMGRVNVTDWISGQELVQLLQPYSN
ncbi:MAG: polysaccharide deacetylase family protein [Oscillospiraceae bacterium]|jgi:peptidoglycan/xylan/chitin deacetylase (PgdA/CDA1 family)|nr:polysaccharide deacetylase family protein [Oscillospiraceae bacterium]